MQNSEDAGLAVDADAEAVQRTSWFAGKAWFWAPVAPLIALDLWSKSVVFAFLARTYPTYSPTSREHVLIESPIGFSLVQWTNKGTIWGLGADFNAVLIGLRIAAVGLLVWFAARTSPRQRIQLLVLGLILAGAVGNLYDNLAMDDRAVRDFLKFYWPYEDGTQWVFPAFNVADSCICVGAISLAIILWREESATSAARRRGPGDGAA